jgi:opacity protein-like surface antigen
MRSAKRHLPIVLLGLVVLCSATAYAADRDRDDQVTTYAGAIGVYNPCNNSLVNVTGTSYVRIHVNTRDHEGVHVSVDLKFVGYGNDDKGNPYRTVLEAKGQFKAEAPPYDLQFRETWEGIKGAPDFSMDGTIRVWVPMGNQITQFDTSCSNGQSDGHDSDKDQDHHSH